MLNAGAPAWNGETVAGGHMVWLILDYNGLSGVILLNLTNLTGLQYFIIAMTNSRARFRVKGICFGSLHANKSMMGCPTPSRVT